MLDENITGDSVLVKCLLGILGLNGGEVKMLDDTLGVFGDSDSFTGILSGNSSLSGGGSCSIIRHRLCPSGSYFRAYLPGMHLLLPLNESFDLRNAVIARIFFFVPGHNMIITPDSGFNPCRQRFSQMQSRGMAQGHSGDDWIAGI